MRALGLLMVLGLASACGQENELTRRSTTDVFTQEPESLVDILWVIDNSASMIEEQERVAESFVTFISSLADTNIDFHIGVVNSDMDLDNPLRGQLLGTPKVITADDDYLALFDDRIRVGVDGSDKEKGLSAAVAALSEPLASGVNSGFLRSDASLLIVFVSDENDCSDDSALEGMPGSACYERADLLIPVTEILDDLALVKGGSGKVLASAIVGPPMAEACANSWHGARFRAVAEATGGLIGNICESDYSDMMGRLGLSVSGVLTNFQLTYVPVYETLEVLIDEDIMLEDPVSGWTYDDEHLMIRFDGDYVPPRGSVITARYEVAGTR